jgi:hypothetical protein
MQPEQSESIGAGVGVVARKNHGVLEWTTVALTSKRRAPLAPSSVAHCSEQLVVGEYVMFMTASQQPSVGHGAHLLPSKYVGGAQEMQPLAASAYCPVGQSERQSDADMAPASEIVPGEQVVSAHESVLPGA